MTGGGGSSDYYDYAIQGHWQLSPLNLQIGNCVNEGQSTL